MAVSTVYPSAGNKTWLEYMERFGLAPRPGLADKACAAGNSAADCNTRNTAASGKFWEKGFQMLENIAERMTISKNNRRSMDELTHTTNYDDKEDGDKKDKSLDGDDDVRAPTKKGGITFIGTRGEILNFAI